MAGSGSVLYMLFSSLSFLIWFLPIVLILHALLPARMRNAFLLLASIFFYAWGEIRYVPLLLALMIGNYALGFLCGSKSGHWALFGLILTLLMNIGTLFYYKYSGWLMETFAVGFSGFKAPLLPLGISFFTFQSQAYQIDIYRGQSAPERSLIGYGTFILLFPQFIAGPIVLYSDVKQDLRTRSLVPEEVENGMMLFLVGLSSKLLLANRLGLIWEITSKAAALSAPAAWLGVLGYGLQIYFDFAGYSLMAIGMGYMLGFHFPQNFNHPYAAVSVRDFWRRWHMTLSRWFRDYVYFPLGGSRAGAGRVFFNLLFVWMLTGLWHGADLRFLLWGLWFFVFLALEHFIPSFRPQDHPFAGRVYALLVVFLGWVLFASESTSQALHYAGNMFAFSNGVDWLFLLRNNFVLLILSVLMCVPPIVQGISRQLQAHPILRLAFGLLLMTLCISSLVSESFNPFLYFRF